MRGLAEVSLTPTDQGQRAVEGGEGDDAARRPRHVVLDPHAAHAPTRRTVLS